MPSEQQGSTTPSQNPTNSPTPPHAADMTSMNDGPSSTDTPDSTHTDPISTEENQSTIAPPPSQSSPITSNRFIEINQKVPNQTSNKGDLQLQLDPLLNTILPILRRYDVPDGQIPSLLINQSSKDYLTTTENDQETSVEQDFAFYTKKLAFYKQQSHTAGNDDNDNDDEDQRNDEDRVPFKVEYLHDGPAPNQAHYQSSIREIGDLIAKLQQNSFIYEGETAIIQQQLQHCGPFSTIPRDILPKDGRIDDEQDAMGEKYENFKPISNNRQQSTEALKSYMQDEEMLDKLYIKYKHKYIALLEKYEEQMKNVSSTEKIGQNNEDLCKASPTLDKTTTKLDKYQWLLKHFLIAPTEYVRNDIISIRDCDEQLGQKNKPTDHFDNNEIFSTQHAAYNNLDMIDDDYVLGTDVLVDLYTLKQQDETYLTKFVKKGTNEKNLTNEKSEKDEQKNGKNNNVIENPVIMADVECDTVVPALSGTILQLDHPSPQLPQDTQKIKKITENEQISQNSKIKIGSEDDSLDSSPYKALISLISHAHQHPLDENPHVTYDSDLDSDDNEVTLLYTKYKNAKKASSNRILSDYILSKRLKVDNIHPVISAVEKAGADAWKTIGILDKIEPFESNYQKHYQTLSKLANSEAMLPFLALTKPFHSYQRGYHVSRHVESVLNNENNNLSYSQRPKMRLLPPHLRPEHPLYNPNEATSDSDDNLSDYDDENKCENLSIGDSLQQQEKKMSLLSSYHTADDDEDNIDELIQRSAYKEKSEQIPPDSQNSNHSRKNLKSITVPNNDLLFDSAEIPVLSHHRSSLIDSAYVTNIPHCDPRLISCIVTGEIATFLRSSILRDHDVLFDIGVGVGYDERKIRDELDQECEDHSVILHALFVKIMVLQQRLLAHDYSVAKAHRARTQQTAGRVSSTNSKNVQKWGNGKTPRYSDDLINDIYTLNGFNAISPLLNLLYHPQSPLSSTNPSLTSKFQTNPIFSLPIAQQLRVLQQVLLHNDEFYELSTILSHIGANGQHSLIPALIQQLHQYNKQQHQILNVLSQNTSGNSNINHPEKIFDFYSNTNNNNSNSSGSNSRSNNSRTLAKPLIFTDNARGFVHRNILIEVLSNAITKNYTDLQHIHNLTSNPGHSGPNFSIIGANSTESDGNNSQSTSNTAHFAHLQQHHKRMHKFWGNMTPLFTILQKNDLFLKARKLAFSKEAVYYYNYYRLPSHSRASLCGGTDIHETQALLQPPQSLLLSTDHQNTPFSHWSPANNPAHQNPRHNYDYVKGRDGYQQTSSGGTLGFKNPAGNSFIYDILRDNYGNSPGNVNNLGDLSDFDVLKRYITDFVDSIGITPPSNTTRNQKFQQKPPSSTPLTAKNTIKVIKFPSKNGKDRNNSKKMGDGESRDNDDDDNDSDSENEDTTDWTDSPTKHSKNSKKSSTIKTKKNNNGETHDDDDVTNSEEYSGSDEESSVSLTLRQLHKGGLKNLKNIKNLNKKKHHDISSSANDDISETSDYSTEYSSSEEEEEWDENDENYYSMSLRSLDPQSAGVFINKYSKFEYQQQHHELYAHSHGDLVARKAIFEAQFMPIGYQNNNFSEDGSEIRVLTDENYHFHCEYSRDKTYLEELIDKLYNKTSQKSSRINLHDQNPVENGEFARVPQRIANFLLTQRSAARNAALARDNQMISLHTHILPAPPVYFNDSGTFLPMLSSYIIERVVAFKKKRFLTQYPSQNPQNSSYCDLKYSKLRKITPKMVKTAKRRGERYARALKKKRIQRNGNKKIKKIRKNPSFAHLPPTTSSPCDLVHSVFSQTPIATTADEKRKARLSAYQKLQIAAYNMFSKQTTTENDETIPENTEKNDKIFDKGEKNAENHTVVEEAESMPKKQVKLTAISSFTLLMAAIQQQLQQQTTRHQNLSSQYKQLQVEDEVRYQFYVDSQLYSSKYIDFVSKNRKSAQKNATKSEEALTFGYFPENLNKNQSIMGDSSEDSDGTREHQETINYRTQNPIFLNSNTNTIQSYQIPTRSRYISKNQLFDKNHVSPAIFQLPTTLYTQHAPLTNNRPSFNFSYTYYYNSTVNHTKLDRMTPKQRALYLLYLENEENIDDQNQNYNDQNFFGTDKSESIEKRKKILTKAQKKLLQLQALHAQYGGQNTAEIAFLTEMLEKCEIFEKNDKYIEITGEKTPLFGSNPYGLGKKPPTGPRGHNLRNRAQKMAEMTAENIQKSKKFGESDDNITDVSDFDGLDIIKSSKSGRNTPQSNKKIAISSKQQQRLEKIEQILANSATIAESSPKSPSSLLLALSTEPSEALELERITKSQKRGEKDLFLSSTTPFLCLFHGIGCSDPLCTGLDEYLPEFGNVNIENRGKPLETGEYSSKITENGQIIEKNRNKYAKFSDMLKIMHHIPNQDSARVDPQLLQNPSKMDDFDILIANAYEPIQNANLLFDLNARYSPNSVNLNSLYDDNGYPRGKSRGRHAAREGEEELFSSYFPNNPEFTEKSQKILESLQYHNNTKKYVYGRGPGYYMSEEERLSFELPPIDAIISHSQLFEKSQFSPNLTEKGDKSSIYPNKQISLHDFVLTTNNITSQSRNYSQNEQMALYTHDLKSKKTSLIHSALAVGNAPHHNPANNIIHSAAQLGFINLAGNSNSNGPQGHLLLSNNDLAKYSQYPGAVDGIKSFSEQNPPDKITKLGKDDDRSRRPGGNSNTNIRGSVKNTSNMSDSDGDYNNNSSASKNNPRKTQKGYENEGNDLGGDSDERLGLISHLQQNAVASQLPDALISLLNPEGIISQNISSMRDVKIGQNGGNNASNPLSSHTNTWSLLYDYVTPDRYSSNLMENIYYSPTLLQSTSNPYYSLQFSSLLPKRIGFAGNSVTTPTVFIRSSASRVWLELVDMNTTHSIYDQQWLTNMTVLQTETIRTMNILFYSFYPYYYYILFLHFKYLYFNEFITQFQHTRDVELWKKDRKLEPISKKKESLQNVEILGNSMTDDIYTASSTSDIHAISSKSDPKPSKNLKKSKMSPNQRELYNIYHATMLQTIPQYYPQSPNHYYFDEGILGQLIPKYTTSLRLDLFFSQLLALKQQHAATFDLKSVLHNQTLSLPLSMTSSIGVFGLLKRLVRKSRLSLQLQAQHMLLYHFTLQQQWFFNVHLNNMANGTAVYAVDHKNLKQSENPEGSENTTDQIPKFVKNMWKEMISLFKTQLQRDIVELQSLKDIYDAECAKQDCGINEADDFSTVLSHLLSSQGDLSDKMRKNVNFLKNVVDINKIDYGILDEHYDDTMLNRINDIILHFTSNSMKKGEKIVKTAGNNQDNDHKNVDNNNNNSNNNNAMTDDIAEKIEDNTERNEKKNENEDNLSHSNPILSEFYMNNMAELHNLYISYKYSTIFILKTQQKAFYDQYTQIKQDILEYQGISLENNVFFNTVQSSGENTIKTTENDDNYSNWVHFFIQGDNRSLFRAQQGLSWYVLQHDYIGSLQLLHFEVYKHHFNVLKRSFYEEIKADLDKDDQIIVQNTAKIEEIVEIPNEFALNDKLSQNMSDNAANLNDNNDDNNNNNNYNDTPEKLQKTEENNDDAEITAKERSYTQFEAEIVKCIENAPITPLPLSKQPIEQSSSQIEANKKVLAFLQKKKKNEKIRLCQPVKRFSTPPLSEIPKVISVDANKLLIRTVLKENLVKTLLTQYSFENIVPPFITEQHAQIESVLNSQCILKSGKNEENVGIIRENSRPIINENDMSDYLSLKISTLSPSQHQLLNDKWLDISQLLHTIIYNVKHGGHGIKECIDLLFDENHYKKNEQSSKLAENGKNVPKTMLENIAYRYNYIIKRQQEYEEYCVSLFSLYTRKVQELQGIQQQIADYSAIYDTVIVNSEGKLKKHEKYGKVKKMSKKNEDSMNDENSYDVDVIHAKLDELCNAEEKYIAELIEMGDYKDFLTKSDKNQQIKSDNDGDDQESLDQPVNYTVVYPFGTSGTEDDYKSVLYHQKIEKRNEMGDIDPDNDYDDEQLLITSHNSIYYRHIWPSMLHSASILSKNTVHYTQLDQKISENDRNIPMKYRNIDIPYYIREKNVINLDKIIYILSQYQKQSILFENHGDSENQDIFVLDENFKELKLTKRDLQHLEYVKFKLFLPINIDSEHDEFGNVVYKNKLIPLPSQSPEAILSHHPVENIDFNDRTQNSLTTKDFFYSNMNQFTSFAGYYFRPLYNSPIDIYKNTPYFDYLQSQLHDSTANTPLSVNEGGKVPTGDPFITTLNSYLNGENERKQRVLAEIRESKCNVQLHTHHYAASMYLNGSEENNVTTSPINLMNNMNSSSIYYGNVLPYPTRHSISKVYHYLFHRKRKETQFLKKLTIKHCKLAKKHLLLTLQREFNVLGRQNVLNTAPDGTIYNAAVELFSGEQSLLPLNAAPQHPKNGKLTENAANTANSNNNNSNASGNNSNNTSRSRSNAAGNNNNSNSRTNSSVNTQNNIESSLSVPHVTFQNPHNIQPQLEVIDGPHHQATAIVLTHPSHQQNLDKLQLTKYTSCWEDLHDTKQASSHTYQGHSGAAGPNSPFLPQPTRFISGACDYIPNMIFDPKTRRNATFINTHNSLVANPYHEMWQDKMRHSLWSITEQQTFLRNYIKFPKNFTKIASALPTKTTADCVTWYFYSKQFIDYKAICRLYNIEYLLINHGTKDRERNIDSGNPNTSGHANSNMKYRDRDRDGNPIVTTGTNTKDKDINNVLNFDQFLLNNNPHGVDDIVINNNLPDDDMTIQQKQLALAVYVKKKKMQNNTLSQNGIEQTDDADDIVRIVEKQKNGEFLAVDKSSTDLFLQDSGNFTPQNHVTSPPMVQSSSSSSHPSRPPTTNTARGGRNAISQSNYANLRNLYPSIHKINLVSTKYKQQFMARHPITTNYPTFKFNPFISPLYNHSSNTKAITRKDKKPKRPGPKRDFFAANSKDEDGTNGGNSVTTNPSNTVHFWGAEIHDCNMSYSKIPTSLPINIADMGYVAYDHDNMETYVVTDPKRLELNGVSNISDLDSYLYDRIDFTSQATIKTIPTDLTGGSDATSDSNTSRNRKPTTPTPSSAITPAVGANSNISDRQNRYFQRESQLWSATLGIIDENDGVRSDADVEEQNSIDSVYTAHPVSSNIVHTNMHQKQTTSQNMIKVQYCHDNTQHTGITTLFGGPTQCHSTFLGGFPLKTLNNPHPLSNSVSKVQDILEKSHNLISDPATGRLSVQNPAAAFIVGGNHLPYLFGSMLNPFWHNNYNNIANIDNPLNIASLNKPYPTHEEQKHVGSIHLKSFLTSPPSLNLVHFLQSLYYMPPNGGGGERFALNFSDNDNIGPQNTNNALHSNIKAFIATKSFEWLLWQYSIYNQQYFSQQQAFINKIEVEQHKLRNGDDATGTCTPDYFDYTRHIDSLHNTQLKQHDTGQQALNAMIIVNHAQQQNGEDPIVGPFHSPPNDLKIQLAEFEKKYADISVSCGDNNEMTPQELQTKQDQLNETSLALADTALLPQYPPTLFASSSIHDDPNNVQNGTQLQMIKQPLHYNHQHTQQHYIINFFLSSLLQHMLLGSNDSRNDPHTSGSVTMSNFSTIYRNNAANRGLVKKLTQIMKKVKKSPTPFDETRLKMKVDNLIDLNDPLAMYHNLKNENEDDTDMVDTSTKIRYKTSIPIHKTLQRMALQFKYHQQHHQHHKPERYMHTAQQLFLSALSLHNLSHHIRSFFLRFHLYLQKQLCCFYLGYSYQVSEYRNVAHAHDAAQHAAMLQSEEEERQNHQQQLIDAIQQQLVEQQQVIEEKQQLLTLLSEQQLQQNDMSKNNCHDYNDNDNDNDTDTDTDNDVTQKKKADSEEVANAIHELKNQLAIFVEQQHQLYVYWKHVVGEELTEAELILIASLLNPSQPPTQQELLIDTATPDQLLNSAMSDDPLQIQLDAESQTKSGQKHKLSEDQEYDRIHDQNHRDSAAQIVQNNQHIDSNQLVQLTAPNQPDEL